MKKTNPRSNWVAPTDKIETVLVEFPCPKILVEAFDRVWRGLGYRSRSEALRDLMRTYLAQQKEAEPIQAYVTET